MLTDFLLMLSPFIQLGTSYYTSVACLMVALAAVNYSSHLISGAGQSIPFLLIAALMLVPPVASGRLATDDDILRCLREAVIFVILVCALRGFQSGKGMRPPSMMLLWIFLVVTLLLVMAQTVFYARGRYFGLPSSLYAFGNDTIADIKDLKYGGGNLRPSGTFSEPSYLGFILLSFAVAVLPRLSFDRKARAMLGVIVITGLLSRSLAFVLAMALVLIGPILLDRRSRHKTRWSGFIMPGLLALAALAFTSAGKILARISALSSTNTADLSTTGRLLGPMAAAPGFLAANPLGAPISRVQHIVATYIPMALRGGRMSLDNAFFNFLFVYGLIGFLIVAAIMVAAKGTRIRLYLLCCMMFNGSFLGLDKLAIILLSMSMYESSRRLAAYRAAQLADFAPGRQLPAIYLSGPFCHVQ